MNVIEVRQGEPNLTQRTLDQQVRKVNRDLALT